MPLIDLATKEDLLPLLQRIEALEKENGYLKRGLTAWVGTEEAIRLTGLHRDTLYDLRKRGELECKYEGKKVMYERTALEAYNESCKPRRKRVA